MPCFNNPKIGGKMNIKNNAQLLIHSSQSFISFTVDPQPLYPAVVPA